MQKNTLYRTSLILLTLLQIGLSTLYLNSLSRIENWSAVYAEDSRGYLLVADYLSGRDIPGEEQPLMRYRLFSPLVPFVAALLGRLTGIPAAFLIINTLLWIAAALFFHELLRIFLQDDYSAFAGAAIFATSLPLIEWGLPVMADMGAYFFAGLIPFLYLRLFHSAPVLQQTGNRDNPCVQSRKPGIMGETGIGLCLALAVLTKPMLAFLLLFVFFSLMREKLYASIAMCCGLPVMLVISIYSAFSLSPQDFTAYGGPRHRGLVYILSAALFSYHWGWLFLRRGWKSAPGYRSLYGIYLLSLSVPYLLFVHNPRLFFLSYPAVIALAAHGMKASCRRVRAGAVLLAAYILTSNILTVLHLYIMRFLKIRDWEGLLHFLK